MSYSVLCTPKCPICFSNYSADVKPKVLYPCGHGMCVSCIASFRSHEEDAGNEDIKCPVCRATVIQEFDNYDLLAITDRVENQDLTYWCRRLLEHVELEGCEIEMHPRIEQFAKVICTRISYNTVLEDMEDKQRQFWAADDLIMFKSFKRIFVNTIKNNKVPAKDALRWLQVLHLPPKIEKIVMQEIVNFYEVKAFLAPMGGEWLMDIFL
jgi:hypothetical protein